MDDGGRIKGSRRCEFMFNYLMLTLSITHDAMDIILTLLLLGKIGNIRITWTTDVSCGTITFLFFTRDSFT